MKFFTNLWRLLLCALVMVPILYGAWAVFALSLIHILACRTGKDRSDVSSELLPQVVPPSRRV